MEEGRAHTRGSLGTIRSAPWLCRLASSCQVRNTGVKRTARASTFTRHGGACPSLGPLPDLPWSQRPLQEDLSRYAENQPSAQIHRRDLRERRDAERGEQAEHRGSVVVRQKVV